MRCPECNRSQRYRQDGMTCKRCGYRYVLDPKKDPMPDAELRRAVEHLGRGGTLAFTRNQLAIELCRRLAGQRFMARLGWSLTGSLVGGALIGLASANVGIGILSMIGLAIVLHPFDRRRRERALRRPAVDVNADYGTACSLVDRYHEVHPIEALATGDAYTEGSGVLDPAPPFTPDRIVLVEHRDLVDMLVRNGAAQRARAVVLSIDGYPTHVAEACRTFLERDPALEIGVLHEGSKAGLGLRERLASHPVWGSHAAQMVELGWSPEAVARQTSRLPWIKGKSLVFTTRHQACLDAGHRLPVDCAPPWMLPGLLAGALTVGAAVAAASGDDGLEIAFEFGTDDFG